MKQSIIFLGILLFSGSSLTYAQENCNPEPPSGLSPLAAYSIFYENYRNGDYEFALEYGRWMVCAKPESLQGNPRFSLENQYDRLITIYKEIGRNHEDPEMQAAYIDTALQLFNESLDMFADNEETEFDIIFKRGRFFQENYNLIDDGLQKAYADYARLFELDAERALSLGDGYYLRQALENLVRQGDKAKTQAFIDNVKPLAEGELLDFIEEKQQEILGSPEEQAEYFKEVVANNPENLEAWKALKGAYQSLNDRPKLKETLIKINELEGSYESAMALGEFAASNANYSEADKYFKEALDRAEGNDLKIDLYLKLADANISMERLETAKSHIQNAIQLDPNDGRTYLKMATLYGTAVTVCTSDRKLEAQDKVVYWVVIDYLNKAKNVQPSLTNTINQQLSTYQQVTPNTEDKFFTLGLENGQKINVDESLMPCYNFINETTTVR